MKEAISTPDLSCITDQDKDAVYEPAEDTFLLLDTLEQDCHLIRSRKPTVILEVGPGSGVVATFISKLLREPALVLAIDINTKAANLTRRLSSSNHQAVQVVIGDLTQCIEEQLYKKIDILIFNPPYVVTPSDEVGTSDLSASWAGGEKGREVLDRLLPKIDSLLSPDGIFYLVIIKENDIDEISKLLEEQKLTTTVMMQRRSGPELLMTLRIQRITEHR